MRNSVNVLGTEYSISFKSDEEVCNRMGVDTGDCGGYCSYELKEIVIADLGLCADTEKEKMGTKKQNLRHEIVHAFLSESGLGWNAKNSECWAKNEEMVDWFAIQGPKIYKAWLEGGAI